MAPTLVPNVVDYDESCNQKRDSVRMMVLYPEETTMMLKAWVLLSAVSGIYSVAKPFWKRWINGRDYSKNILLRCFSDLLDGLLCPTLNVLVSVHATTDLFFTLLFPRSNFAKERLFYIHTNKTGFGWNGKKWRKWSLKDTLVSKNLLFVGVGFKGYKCRVLNRNIVESMLQENVD